MTVQAQVPTREQLLVLADRAERGRLSPAEAARLRMGVQSLAQNRFAAYMRRRRADELATVRRMLTRLHQPMTRGGLEICKECSGWDGRLCRGLLTPWPCPTAEVAGLESPAPKENAA